MDQLIANQLEQEELTPFHQKMLTHCRALVSMSRQAMSKNYTAWDRHDDIYRGISKPDEDDKKANERGEPIKMIVPLTKAQIDTAVAFTLALYTQRPEVYGMEGTGIEDWKPAKIGTALLQRDLEVNNYNLKFFQWLTDGFKFGLGVMKHSWVKETQRVPTEVTKPAVMVGPFQLFAEKTSTVVEEQTKFLGNRLYPISPFRFFPDPRLPLTRFQEGEFCASEDEVPRTQLMRQQKDGYYAGVQHIKTWSKEDWDKRGGPHGNRLPFAGFVEQTGTAGATRGSENMGRAVAVTEMQVNIIPKEFEIEPGQPLGQEDYPIKYIVCIANDSRIIKCEPMGYLHDEFTYDLIQYNPDQHHFVNGGLAEAIDELQSVITWLINSHITAVRKTIQNYLIVDPEMVNMDDLKERRSVIRTKKGASMSGIDRYIKQLEVRDVTQNNIRDAGGLGELVQQITGVNENASGQYSKGRRSAEQTRAANAGAATRLRIVAMLMWSSGFLPLGRKMLSNLRDGLDEETFVKVLGMQTVQPIDPNAVNIGDFATRFKVSKKDLIGNYDFAMLDGTLPNEKAQMAGILQELLTAMFANPQVAAVFGFNPQALLQELLELRGIRNPERFKAAPTLPPGGLEQVNMQVGVAQQLAGGGQPQPQQEAQPQAGAPVQGGLSGPGPMNEQDILALMQQLPPELLQSLGGHAA